MVSVMGRLNVACKRTTIRRLPPVLLYTQVVMTLKAKTPPTKGTEKVGVLTGSPVNHRGRCHKAHIGARKRLALRALIRVCRRGRTYPLHPISSPSALPGKMEKARKTAAPTRGIPKLRAGPPRRAFKGSTPAVRATGTKTTTKYQRGLTLQIRSRPSSFLRAPLPKTMAVRTIAITEGTLEARMTKTKPWVSERESVMETSGLSMAQVST